MIRTDGRLFADAPMPGFALASTVAGWHETWRQRRALARLDARMLADVGLTADTAQREVARPFWDIDAA